MHEKLGQRRPAVNVRFVMLRDALCGRDRGDLDGRQHDETRSLFLQQLRALRCGYVYTAAGEEEGSYLSHLEQNREHLEEIVGKVKKLTVASDVEQETGDLFDLDGWKSLDQSEIDEDSYDVWSEPKDWKVELELEQEEEDFDSAWSVTDAPRE
jgi:hypothetical protein